MLFHKLGIFVLVCFSLFVYLYFCFSFFQPLLPGEKRVKEFWENTWVYGMGFNFFLLFIVAVFSPDTRYGLNISSVWSRGVSVGW